MGLSLEEMSMAMAESVNSGNETITNYRGIEADTTELDDENIYQLLAERIGQGIIREGGNY